MSFGSDLYTRMVSSFLFPLHEKIKGHSTVSLLDSLEKSQWLSPYEIERIQNRKLRFFLEKISEHVPYYEKLFHANKLNISSVDSIQDLNSIEFLTKDLIRLNENALRSEVGNSLILKLTGGSTGAPLRFFVGKDRVSHDVAARWRSLRWWGADIGDRELVLWGAPAELGSQGVMRIFRDNIFRSRLVYAVDISESNIAVLVKTIKHYRPKVIFGYPSTLAYFARFSKDNGFSFSDCGVKVVFVTSEILYPDQREIISSAFGCPVANEYGGRDSGFIARECPEGRMHISAEDIIVEIVDETGEPVHAGESGEVVITHLATSEFPFLRYKTGDVAIIDDAQCPCGLGLPVLKEVVGRSNDLLFAQNGSVVHPNVVNYIIREFSNIIAYKVIQESLKTLRVVLEVLSPLSTKDKDAIRSMFCERLGADLSVVIDIVDKIPPEKSGKHRFVVSHCTPKRGAA